MKRTILAATIVAVTACGGGDATLSPVGPSRTSSSAGASISGTVSGTGVTATRTLDGGAFSMLASSSVTVSIAGTNISTTTDGQGQFTLNNVPAGTVTLNFTAPGSSATITLTGIGPDDKVQIQVTLNGNNARVDSEHHSSPGNDKKEFQGRISSIDATAKSFQIPGLTIKTTATTTIRHGNKTLQFTDLKVGDHIQAKGTMDGTTVTATEIKVEDNEDDGDNNDDNNNQGNEVEGVVSASTGTCPAVTFMVRTTKVTTNSATSFRDGTCADATANGATVDVQGTKQTDGSILATRVQLEKKAPAATTVTLTGFISGSTGTCPAVTFTVQSTKVTVNSSTTFPSTTCADATKNDANVTVTGTKQADGSVVATSISLVPPTTLTGAVSGSTGTCPAVTFTVQSTKVTVNSSTTYTATTCAAATANAANVKVTGPKQVDGSVLATTVALAP